MFCDNCGKSLLDGTKVCPFCNANLENFHQPPLTPGGNSRSGPVFTNPQQGYRMPRPEKPKKPRYSNNKKPKLWLSVTSLVLSVLMIVPLVFSIFSVYAQTEPAASDKKGESKVQVQASGEKEYETDKIKKGDISSKLNGLKPNDQGSKKVRAEIEVVEEAIDEAVSQIESEYSTIDEDTVDYYLDAVGDSLRELYNDDLIKSYTVGDDCISVELNFGGYYIYAPEIEGYDAGSSPELTIATYQPFYSEGQYENVMSVRDNADDGAKTIDDEFDVYTFNEGGSNDTDFNDSEVTPESCEGFANHNVILWHGHGCYHNQFGSLVCLGIERTDDTDSKYHSILMAGDMYYTDDTYLVGADFFDNYLEDGSLDNTVLYIGTCSAGVNNRLANVFLNKGAQAVYAPSDSVLTVYNAEMIRSVCDGLSKQNSDGTYYNVEQALTYAQETNGKTDDGTSSGAEIRLFTNNSAFSLDWYMDYVVSERDVVLALDISGSMNGKPLNETKEAAKEFVETVLKEDARIGIVTYDSNAEIKCNFSTRKQYLTDSISSLYTRGSTNIDQALQRAESMLSTSKAKKKIIVLMSDGVPNVDRQGDDLVKYAESIKDKDIYIYTLGFFDALDANTKAKAQDLMDRIATEGHHYEVSNAEDLVFFFGDMADTISGQKYIYVEIACPVDVKVKKGGETLDSSDGKQARTSFGTLTFVEPEKKSEDSQKEVDEDDLVKILRLKDGMEYDIEISGTGSGEMNYTIQYMDENGDYSDKREFEDVPITRSTEISTVASATREETILSVDEDGDGHYDFRYKAGKNETGEEYENPIKFILILCGVDLLWILISVLIIVLQSKKLKYLKTLKA